MLASVTSFVGDHGVYAVFLLMATAAVVPVGSELVMLYAGSLAATAGPTSSSGATAAASPRAEIPRKLRREVCCAISVSSEKRFGILQRPL